jgi:hypothetical protein
MPCNLRAELIKAVNSSPSLKAIHQRYLKASASIILKMDSQQQHKYNSNEYLSTYKSIRRPLIDDFTLEEKLFIITMELDNLQLTDLLTMCSDFNHVLAGIMDKKFLH